MSIGSPKGEKTKHTQIIADIHTQNDGQREKKIRSVEREGERVKSAPQWFFLLSISWKDKMTEGTSILSLKQQE